MSIRISGYDFEGPYASSDTLENRSGVYVVGYSIDAGRWRIIDVGESANIRTRIENHDRKDCWRRHASNGYQFGVYYTPEARRMQIEKRIRAECNPPCGKK